METRTDKLSRLLHDGSRAGLRLAALFGALTALLVVPACDSDDVRNALKGDSATSGTVLAAVSQVLVGVVPGVPTGGPQPEGTSTDFALTLTPGSAAVTNGGTATITASATSAFSEVYLGVTGLDAYYLLELPAPVTSTELFVTLDQDYNDPTVTFSVSAGDGVDTGPIAEQEFVVVIVGTGDVQVSLTMDRQDDLDLWVVDPAGDTVWWQQRTVSSGGTLDLDANAGCFTNFGNSENVTWPEGSAPVGIYEVYVQLFDTCSNMSVNYTVTVTVAGTPPEIFTGSFDPGDAGGAEAFITAFEVIDPAEEEPPPAL